MHIVRIQGGLGNQMFQYALYYKFQNMGYDTYADLYAYRQTKYKERSYQLPIWNINLRRANKKDIKKLAGNQNSYINDLWLKYVGRRNYYKEKEVNKFKREIFSLEEGYFDGYWQSEKYFKNIETEIKEQYILREDLKEQVEKSRIVDDISQAENSVSIHVRLGDYLLNNEMYGGICTPQYYSVAMNYIRERVSNPTFYLFSDNIEMAKQMIIGENVKCVIEGGDSKGYVDMILMSMCKHHIIANSSFSWWGAWLSKYVDGITIAPSKWINKEPAMDIVPDSWIKI